MRAINAYKVGFVVLVIANIIHAFLFFRKPERPPFRRDAQLGRMERQAGLMEKISNQLDLNEEQQTRYFELAQLHRGAMTELEKKQKGLIASYFDNLKSDQPDSVAVASILSQLQTIEGRKLSLTYSHFEELKAICTDDQKAQFESIMGEVIAVLIGTPEKLPPPTRD